VNQATTNSMKILGKETITYQDKLYYIYRRVKVTQLKAEYVSEVKEFWMCDIVIRGRYQNEDESFLFLREISEATVISQT
jgi:hypothetical protein